MIKVYEIEQERERMRENRRIYKNIKRIKRGV